uniref:Si:ch211-38m6.7 n=1 Tax=Echeneis naucrates TaxID=173247 RepID=A0A665TFN1_ECHNA
MCKTDTEICPTALWCRSRTGSEGLKGDRAVLLGFAMMAFSVLMFFVASVTTVKHFVNRYIAVCCTVEERMSCDTDCLTTYTLTIYLSIHTNVWQGVSTVPCLRVMVNLMGSNQSAFLHFDEDSKMIPAPYLLFQCFYMPKCQMDRAHHQAEVQELKQIFDIQLGNATSCFTDHTKHPGGAILTRKYTLKKALFALLWPCLMLCGGALLVGLVKLTQCLAHLSSEMCSETKRERPFGST